MKSNHSKASFEQRAKTNPWAVRCAKILYQIIIVPGEDIPEEKFMKNSLKLMKQFEPKD